nr:response regulator [arsenite-oxidising bacterium NT-25]
MSDNALIGLRILVVEDEALVCMLLEDMLADLGCDVVATAARLEEAVALAGRGGFDAAILDVNLGSERSYPVADMLAERGTPFLFSTGYDNLQEGYNALPRIQKPYRLRELANVLSAVVAAHQTAS